MPYPPFPALPAPFTWTKGQSLQAPWLRNDVVNALLLIAQPPVFSGSQTGSPVAFTSIAGTSITAPGTSYTLNQPVVFSSSGGGFPSGLTAGQIYYVYNPVGPVFGIATTAGATSPYTGYGAGSGTVATTQIITASAWTGVNLDTEPGAGDPWGGHQISANMPYFYGMFPGVYLVDFTFPANWTSGGGGVSAGLLTQEGTGLPVTVGGQCGPVSASAGRYSSVSVARLVQFSVTGTYGGAGNNYAGAAAWQDAATAMTPLATPTRFALMNAEWVCALTGNPALPVPDNDPWPEPPLGVGATFANKNVRDTIGFLAFRPTMEAYYAPGGFLIPAAASLPALGTPIPLSGVTVDNRSAFGPIGSAFGWTAPVPGVYDLYGQVPVNATGTLISLAAGLTVTSANYNSGSSFTVWGAPQQALNAPGEVNCAIVRRRLRVNAGDTVLLAGFAADSASNPGTVPYGTWAARIIAVFRNK